jgi:beta-galactosidase
MILAAQYYRPPFPERPYWKQDLDDMKAAGLNAVQLWVLWSWVEPEPGRFVFDDYDELVEEAGKRGLGVVLSSIGELQPMWIHRVIPDGHMVDHMGHAVISTNRGEANQGLTPGGCTDHPEVLRRMGTFLEQVASRYRNAGNLLGWDIWNELRWNVQADGLVCFCPSTLAAFRGWLQDKYRDLDGLNAAWKRRYCSWEDVQPGKLPRRPYTEMMEFEAFLQWRMAQHMRWRSDIIRSADGRHIVTAHGAQPSVHMAGDMENHALNRGNDWELSESLDGVGCSHFPFWFAMSDEDFGVRVECTRSAAQGKVVWVSELQGGSARQGFDTRPSVQARPQQRWVWNGYGRGAKAVIFWCWRDEVFGRESSGYGLAGLDGLANERIAAMQQTGAILQQHGSLLESYTPDTPRVGVMFDPHGYTLEWAQDGSATRARDSVLGYLKALERINVPYTVIESSHLDALRDVSVLIWPFPLVTLPGATDEVAAFVERGGTLVIEAEAGAYTDVGFYNYPGADRPLAHRLGIRDLGRRPLNGASFTLAEDGKSYELKPGVMLTPLTAEGAEVLARDAEGNGLATQRSVGRGTVISLGTFIGQPYCEQAYADFERLLLDVVTAGGGLPDLRVEGEKLQWRTGRAGDQRLLFVANSGERQRVRVSGPAAPNSAATAATELHTGASLPISGSAFELDIDAGDYAIAAWTA